MTPALLALASRVEVMAPHFVKYHLDGLPFPAVLHHFTAPDSGDPHDHPWSFTSHILAGGYVEEVWGHRAGRWGTMLAARTPGTAHRVEATHVYRIIHLPHGECWTLVVPGLTVRTSRFWRFDPDGTAARSRAWHESDWTPLEVAA